MNSEIIVGALSLIGTVLGTFCGILTSAKLTTYRIDQLEKKVEKHNTVVERMALAEKDIKAVWKNIDSIKADIKDMEGM